MSTQPVEEPDNPQHPVDLLNRADAMVAMDDAVVAMDDAEVDAMDGAMGDAVVGAMDGADNMLPHSSNYLHWDFDPLAFWRMSP
ncbi:hypothetical protein IJ21_12930 [Paenibacillus sp. 32O-W]|uniref:hypothetical protein n=1 Tax=Paenibacillus sp. 32O-W TaxID=1695218 RepID=UPI000720A3AE|nr:hypothetical protein [Paenibacillus sp. 32O-W]ALS26697.1 hypothetical protein IJ21_12930 [Paenibacillus sp. 32O-W]